MESGRLFVSRALALGGLAGALETLLALTTGTVPANEIALNFAILVATFGGVAAFWTVVRRFFRLSQGSGEYVLVLVSILLFALRGCLGHCGDEDRWNFASPVTITLVAMLLLAAGQRVWPTRGGRDLPVIATAAMTLAALDFARRDGVLLGWGAIIAVALSMVVLGTLPSLWLARRGWVANLLWTASLAFVTLSGANFQVRPLWIEPTVQDAAPPRAAAESQAPNVVLVVLDTVRAENLSLYGYARKTTPNLDALAAESLVFDRAISSGNYTLPSHASLFTGLLPGQHGAREFLSGTEATGLSRDVETLASRLRASGFTTGGVSANFVYLAPWTGLQRGLEIFDDRPRRLLSYHTFSFSLRRSLVSPRPPPRDPEGWDGESVTAAGSHFATRAREPFFLFLNYLDAHVPYAPLAGRKFRGDGVGSDVGLIPDYDSAIAYTDSALGKLVDGLRRASILDRTVLVITSDHGEFLGEHGFTYHHRGAYEEVLHVPLLVRYPKGLRRGRVQRPFGLHEVHRLILDLVESRPTGWVDAQEAEPRVLAQVWGRITSRDEFDGARGIEPGANVVYLDSFKMIGRSEGENELYDLSKDPREEHNLLILPTPEIEVLAKRMQAAIERLPPSRLGEDPNATSADIEGLKALGYISVKKPVKKPGAPQ